MSAAPARWRPRASAAAAAAAAAASAGGDASFVSSASSASSAPSAPPPAPPPPPPPPPPAAAMRLELHADAPPFVVAAPSAAAKPAAKPAAAKKWAPKERRGAARLQGGAAASAAAPAQRGAAAAAAAAAAPGSDSEQEEQGVVAAPGEDARAAPRARAPKIRASDFDLSEFPVLGQRIATQLLRQSYECAICFGRIFHAQAVWSCGTCYAPVHFACMQKWTSALNLPSATAAASAGGRSRCPNCQGDVVFAARPECFCGNHVRPALQSLVMPHSCGEQCRRARTCAHPCPLLCHPGPCPPCSIVVVSRCNCGRQSLTHQCSSAAETSCGEVCGRTLACGAHRCEQVCHAGACQPCPVRVDVRCACGKAESRVACGAPVPSCGAVCGRLRDCGAHACDEVCHPGRACAPCALQPSAVSRCPCGALPLSFFRCSRTRCTDPIPTCENQCRKRLDCGHLCAAVCHAGACPPCAVVLERSCACGRSRREMPCGATSAPGSAAWRCEVRCHRLRSCGRHRCPALCCTLPDAHDCELPCKRTLRCGLHTCPLPCHAGPCPPCLNASFDVFACPCGRTVVEPPIPCGAVMPPCPHPCSVRRACGHPPHHACHPANEACPPCPVLVTRACDGGHTAMHNVRCGQGVVSCGQPCDKLLPCSLHRCPRICHAGACVEKEARAVRKGCGLECGVALPCGHQCNSKCHPQSRCPKMCSQDTKVRCECGLRFEDWPCSRVELAWREHAAAAASRGAVVVRDSGAGASAGDGTEAGGAAAEPAQPAYDCRAQPVLLECDDECERNRRLRSLATALGLIPAQRQFEPFTSEDLQRQAGFSASLLELASRRLSFVLQLEKQFAEFIHSGEPEVALHNMSAPDRKAVHELAVHYGLATQSAGFDPNRYVVLRATETSKIPLILLSFFNDVFQPHALIIEDITRAVREPNVARPLLNAGLLRHHFRIAWPSNASALVFFDGADTLHTGKNALRKVFDSVRAVDPENLARLLPAAPSMRGTGGAVSSSAWDAASDSSSSSGGVLAAAAAAAAPPRSLDDAAVPENWEDALAPSSGDSPAAAAAAAAAASSSSAAPDEPLAAAASSATTAQPASSRSPSRSPPTTPRRAT